MPTAGKVCPARVRVRLLPEHLRPIRRTRPSARLRSESKTPQTQGPEDIQSLEKVMLFVSLFSMAAWTDLMMSWVCSMLMFQVAM